MHSPTPAGWLELGRQNAWPSQRPTAGAAAAASEATEASATSAQTRTLPSHLFINLKMSMTRTDTCGAAHGSVQ